MGIAATDGSDPVAARPGGPRDNDAGEQRVAKVIAEGGKLSAVDTDHVRRKARSVHREDKPVDSGAEVPIIDKKPGQVFAVNPTGVQIMDLETYEYLDAPYPEEEEIKAKLVSGVEIEYWKIMGKIKITRVK